MHIHHAYTDHATTLTDTAAYLYTQETQAVHLVYIAGLLAFVDIEVLNKQGTTQMFPPVHAHELYKHPY